MATPYTGMNQPYSGVTSGSGVRQVYTSSTTGLPTAGYTTTGYTTTGAYTPTYETTYLGAPTTTYLGGQTTTYTGPTQTYVSAPVTTTQTYVSGPVTTGQTYVSGYTGSSVGVVGTHQKVVAEEIPVESRIEYIPF